MSIQLTNIVNGVLEKLKRKKHGSRFAAMTWMQQKRLKHEEDQQIKTIYLGKIKLSYKRPYEVLHTYKELFEDGIYNFTASTASPLIIDCGANIGLSVLYFKLIYPHATVLAYEPDADNLSLLQKNIAQNHLPGVECRQRAVWIHNDTITFASNGTQGSSITMNEGQKNVVHLKAERLADILKEQKVDFLKIDIEGAELDVIKDCEPYLYNVEQIFVEYHGKVAETEKLTQLLQALKKEFKIYIKLAADNLQQPFVNKSTGGAFDVQLNIFCYR